MREQWKDLLNELEILEDKIGKKLREKQDEFNYKIEKGKLRFERKQLKRFKELRRNVFSYLVASGLLEILTAPVIYSLIIPAIIIDIFTTVYQTICFPVYGIPRVKRSEYVVLDRHHLKHLNFIERLNCSSLV